MFSVAPAKMWSAWTAVLLALWLVDIPTAGAQQLDLTQEEKSFLREHPVIRVHNETDWPPFNFFEDGTSKGFSIDYMNLLASMIGVDVEYVTGPTWSEFLSLMKNGELDVMLNIVKTPEREEYLLYTKTLCPQSQFDFEPSGNAL